MSEQQIVGHMADSGSVQVVWMFSVGIGVMNILRFFLLRQRDKKVFSLLYK